MKYSKAVYVNAHDIKGNSNREYDVFTNGVVNNETTYLVTKYAKDFACQYDNIRDSVICTCKKRAKRDGNKYFNTSRQVYRSQRYRSAGFTDIGVGSIKTLQKKRVKRIYLPDTEDRGVGSTDLTSFIRRPRNEQSSYYDQKKTSSKCVGGLLEYNNISVLCEKLSPICTTKSGSTSPKRTSFEDNKRNDNHSIPDPIVNLVMRKKHVKGDNSHKEQDVAKPNLESLACTTHDDKVNEISGPNTSKIKSAPTIAVNLDKELSSDSLVQHIHNLEKPSSFKHSKTSIDSMLENKLEREYIKMFSQITKQGKPIAEVRPVHECNSTSMRRRFEALRRDLYKKVSDERGIVIKSSSQNSALRKDVSITSDPPSLEARSFTNAKIFSPVPSPLYKYVDVPQTSHKKSVTSNKRSSQWTTDIVENDCQNVKGMFKLWGQKFNLEDDCYKKSPPFIPDSITKHKKKVELIIPKEEVIETQKKEGKRFSFFKKKHKEKARQPFKSKKGVTAGRCEVGDGLTIKIGAANDYTPEAPKRKSEKILDENNDMLKKAWLKRCLDNKNDSRNSVKIRWNNEMYTTSSSTVFELMECVYKNSGLIFTSRSETTTTTVPTTTMLETPYYHAHKNQQVNFMQQTVQAWMIPKMITGTDLPKPKNKNDIEISFSDQKWFIDKSKAFSQKIELVLHSTNYEKVDAAQSSEYIVIDIPKGYFLDSSEDEPSQSSDEQVFNIVEYETAKSSSYCKKGKMDHTCDHEKDIRVTLNINQNKDKETNVLENVIKTPLHRDVVVQGSNVYVPKRCDVISVGIITQHTHNRDMQQSILGVQDEITDDDSTHSIPPQKKCELAESYLQDYYRHWVPLGIDLYSWFISDSNLRASSDNNSLNSFNNQGDGSKSCPNIYDDYQASCTTSSRSQCRFVDETKADDTTNTYFNKLNMNPDPQLSTEGGGAGAEAKRVLPKDSLEVCKRRKIYAASKVKADWCAGEGLEPLSKPSILDKFAQKLSRESICQFLSSKCKKKMKKHVSLKDVKKKGDSIMSVKGSFICSKCQKKAPCSKHAFIAPEPTREVREPPCFDLCTKKLEKDSSLHDSSVPEPPIFPADSPSPRQPASPPIPSPCSSDVKIRLLSPPPNLPPSSPSRSFSRQCCKCSPPSSQQKPLVPSSSPPTTVPTSKPLMLSRFLSRRTKQKDPSRESRSKLKKQPSERNHPSPPHSPKPCRPCSPPISPPDSPLLPKNSDLCKKLRSFARFIPGRSKQNPSSIDSFSKQKKPPCASPATARSPLSTNPSPPHNINLSPPGSQQKTPCKECSKLKNPPCFIKHSAPSAASLPKESSLKPTCLNCPCPVRRTKVSPPSYKSKLPCESCMKIKSPPGSQKVQCCVRQPEELPPKSPTREENSKKSVDFPQCLSSKNSPCCIQEFPRPIKKVLTPKESNISLEKPPPTEDECNSLTTKKYNGDCDPDCPLKCKEISEESIPVTRTLSFGELSSPNTRSHPKLTGVHLKKLPMPRQSSDENKPGVIKLNSKENFTIRRKPITPSTEEIREGCNIKVQDEDGQTLYERREYKMDTSQARKALVKDMYRASRIHRISTSKTEALNEKTFESSESKSNTSLSNIVEINLNLKFKQTEKSTDINIKNCDVTPKDNQNEKLNSQASKDIYLLHDKTNQSNEKMEDIEKKDVNIKIIINSYQQSPSKSTRKIIHQNLHADEDFSRKISEKFHTVSTGYSGVLDQQPFSMHRLINFTDSADSKLLTNLSKQLVTNELTQEGPKKLPDIECVPKHSKGEPSLTPVTVNTTETVESQLLPSDNSQIKYSETNWEITVTDTVDEKSTTGISGTDNDEILFSDIQCSNEKISKIRNKEQKKKILKQIFEDSINSRNTPNKSKMRRIRKMLQAVLTSDSSDRNEGDSVNHELANELAYESLKPNFLNNSNSMTNYYQIHSSISDTRSSMNESEEILHPTATNNSSRSGESRHENEKETKKCLCSQLAAKLNIHDNNNFKACCCRGNARRDEEIDCDLLVDVITNYIPNYVDVETQDSNFKGKQKKSGETIGFNTIQTPEVNQKHHKPTDKLPKQMFSYASSIKVCKVNRNAVLNLSKDDKFKVFSSETDEPKSTEDDNIDDEKFDPIDILQLDETKKAVLEIYAEKTVFNEKERMVAKLPKFIYKTEREICNYGEMFTGFHEYSARNYIMMSMTR